MPDPSDPKPDGLPSIRTIYVVEVRHAPTADGPWTEPVAVGTDNRDQPEWCEPFDWPERGVWCVNRVVPYVPESELERYRAVVQAAIKVSDHPGTCCAVCRGFVWSVDDKKPEWGHDDDCPLVVNAFITKEGEAIR